jgi:hypothetical protein
MVGSRVHTFARSRVLEQRPNAPTELELANVRTRERANGGFAQ